MLTIIELFPSIKRWFFRVRQKKRQQLVWFKTKQIKQYKTLHNFNKSLLSQGRIWTLITEKRLMNIFLHYDSMNVTFISMKWEII